MALVHCVSGMNGYDEFLTSQAIMKWRKQVQLSNNKMQQQPSTVHCHSHDIPRDIYTKFGC